MSPLPARPLAVPASQVFNRELSLLKVVLPVVTSVGLMVSIGWFGITIVPQMMGHLMPKVRQDPRSVRAPAPGSRAPRRSGWQRALQSHSCVSFAVLLPTSPLVACHQGAGEAPGESAARCRPLPRDRPRAGVPSPRCDQPTKQPHCRTSGLISLSCDRVERRLVPSAGVVSRRPLLLLRRARPSRVVETGEASVLTDGVIRM